MDDQKVFTFQKSATEEICFSLKHYMGHDLVDVRVYCRSYNGTMVPTGKGICLKLEAFGNLREGIAALGKALEENKKGIESNHAKTEETN